MTLHERYDGNVFRTGEEAREDYVTSFLLGVGWFTRTGRSTTRIQYQPEYFKYASFDALDNLDHRLQSAWEFRPGRRSSVGFQQTFVRSSRQSGFRDFDPIAGEPILSRTQRDIWSIGPFYRVDLNRRWTLETRASYRVERFERGEFVDSEQLGFEVSGLAQVGREHQIGVLLGGDALDFDSQNDFDERFDRFVKVQALWSRRAGEILSWNASAGLFRASGPLSASELKPSAKFSMSWDFQLNHLFLAYDLGYSASGGIGRSSRSESAGIGFHRRWSRAFQTTVRAAYISREPLADDESFPGADVDGYELDYDASYRWLSGLGVAFHYAQIRQNRSQSPDLDYQLASLAISYAARPDLDTLAAGRFPRTLR